MGPTHILPLDGCSRGGGSGSSLAVGYGSGVPPCTMGSPKPHSAVWGSVITVGHGSGLPRAAVPPCIMGIMGSRNPQWSMGQGQTRRTLYHSHSPILHSSYATDSRYWP